MDRPPSPDRRGIDATGIAFSDLEVEVLHLITHAWTNLEIAEALGVDAGTVKSQIRSAYQKTGSANRIEAVIWGARHGLAGELAAPRR